MLGDLGQQARVQAPVGGAQVDTARLHGQHLHVVRLAGVHDSTEVRHPPVEPVDGPDEHHVDLAALGQVEQPLEVGSRLARVGRHIRVYEHLDHPQALGLGQCLTIGLLALDSGPRAIGVL